MRWSALVGIAASPLWIAAAEAQQITQIAPFTSRCVETEATGFNWEKGKWQRVNFTLTTQLIQKFDAAKHAGASSVCDSVEPDEPVILDTFAALAGCYSAGGLDEKPLFDWCDEHYDKIDGQWRLESIECPWIGEYLSFKPDGAFVYSMYAADLSDKPAGDYKDSLKLSHGRCRGVTG